MLMIRRSSVVVAQLKSTTLHSVRMSACLDEVANWMLSNRLQLNPDKTELLWCSTTRRLKSLQLQPIRVGDDLIEPSDCVRDLGVYIDCGLTMRSHILKVAGGCYSVLRQLRSVRRSVPTDVFCMHVGSMVVSRLDYCNATLARVSTTLYCVASNP
jgi:hypothetical protein